MKRLFFLLAFASAVVSAAVVTTDVPVHVLTTAGAAPVEYATHEACVAAAVAASLTATWECRPTTKVTTTVMPDWVKAADEGGVFSLAKPTLVRYGAAGQYLTATLSGQVICSNDTFGADPIFGTAKECAVAPGDLPSVTGLSQPADESQQVSCPAGSITGASWRQTRTYAAAPSPTFWSPQAWLPAQMPTGACPKPAPVTMHAGWHVDDSTVDFSHILGATDVRIGDLVQFPTPSPDGSGDFRTVCYRTTMGYFDPIVHPGVENSAHLHQFFCNDAIRAGSTADTLLTEGGSTSRGGAMNKSSVWTPTFVDSRNGKAIPARAAIVYYKTGSFPVLAEQEQPVPIGLKMVIGEPGAMSYTRWGIAGFSCNGESVGQDHDEPFISGSHVIPTKEQCGPGKEIWMGAVAPNCWDGVNLDSPDHKSHMAYPAVPWNADTLPNGCQKDHPVLIPQVAIIAITPVGPDDDPTFWVLSSDHEMPAAMKGPGDLVLPNGNIVKRGVSMHADYFAHWLPEWQDLWLNKCVRAKADCSAHMLGDGRTMGFFGGN